MVGAGSAGAVIASRLSEDPTCRVALLEAGHRPPAEELIPAGMLGELRDRLDVHRRGDHLANPTTPGRPVVGFQERTTDIVMFDSES